MAAEVRQSRTHCLSASNRTPLASSTTLKPLFRKHIECKYTATIIPAILSSIWLPLLYVDSLCSSLLYMEADAVTTSSPKTLASWNTLGLAMKVWQTGFTIRDLLYERKVNLAIPAFTQEASCLMRMSQAREG